MAAMPFPASVEAYIALRFPEPPAGRPYVILNMVASADGKAAIEGGEAALSSRADKLTLQSLRIHADAILNGASTARMTGANPRIRDPRLQRERAALGRSEPPLQVVVTEYGAIPLDALFLRSRTFQSVLFTGAATLPDQVERLRSSGRPVEVLPPGEAAMPELLARLRLRYGVKLLLLEGGPSLNASFFHAGLIDEFFLTIGPHIVAGRETLTPVEGRSFTAATMPALELISALPSKESNEIYLHWRVRYPARL